MAHLLKPIESVAPQTIEAVHIFLYESTEFPNSIWLSDDTYLVIWLRKSSNRLVCRALLAFHEEWNSIPASIVDGTELLHQRLGLHCYRALSDLQCTQGT